LIEQFLTEKEQSEMEKEQEREMVAVDFCGTTARRWKKELC
jgi:hypothetical protein